VIAQTQLKPDAVARSLLNEYERLKIEEHQLKASESALTAAKGHGKGRCTGNGSTGSGSNSNKTNAKC